jgi:hypothetical protein
MVGLNAGIFLFGNRERIDRILRSTHILTVRLEEASVKVRLANELSLSAKRVEQKHAILADEKKKRRQWVKLL